MDDPSRQILYLDGESHELRSAVCPKRYFLHVVLVLKAAGSLVSVQRYRVQLDRSGIRSLDSISINDESSWLEKG